MGGVCSGKVSQGTKEEQKQNDAINAQIKEEKKKLGSQVKLLLLGAGDSGKSTIAKQMKIIHDRGFSKEELESYKSVIHSNIVGSMRAIIHAARDFNIPIGCEETAVRFENHPRGEQFSGEFTLDIAKDVKELWADEGVQKTYARQSEFQLNDSSSYYFENADRLAQPNYVPTEQDVLRSRQRTTGVIETEFQVETTTFRMVDVGGQKSERRKWMNCFEDVTAVVFCVALSDYDLKLYEDNDVNRMHDALKLFADTCNAKHFEKVGSLIIFLNKKDLFEQKIKKVDLKGTFPDYKGGPNYEQGLKFIQDKFVSQNNNSSRLIYVHATCATDTENVQVVFKAVKETILHQVLTDTGMY